MDDGDRPNQTSVRVSAKVERVSNEGTCSIVNDKRVAEKTSSLEGLHGGYVILSDVFNYFSFIVLCQFCNHRAVKAN